MDPTSRRLAAASGVAFVALFILGMLMLDLPGHDDLDDSLNSFYSEGGNRARVTVAAYFLGGAGVSFLWLAYHLRRRLWKPRVTPLDSLILGSRARWYS